MTEVNSEVSFPRPGPEWLDAPDESTPRFFPTFARVSIAIQTVLREQVPTHYFASSEVFANPKIAYPMLAYRASQPFRGKMRTELTYDVLNPKTLASFFRSVRPALPEVLEAVRLRLIGEGHADLAASYEPRRADRILDSIQSLSKSRRALYVLIRGEGSLVTSMFDLAGLGTLPFKQQARRIAAFEKKWRYQLRRMYVGTDFTWLAGDLLNAATAALPEPVVPYPDPPPLLDEPEAL